jgi:hypothetical protein
MVKNSSLTKDTPPARNNYLSESDNDAKLPVLAQSFKSRQEAPQKPDNAPLPLVFVKIEAGATLDPTTQYFMMDGAVGTFQ